MSGVVLDTSAIIALINEEPGGERVGQVVRGASVSVVNLCEVVGYLIFRGLTPDMVNDALEPLEFTTILADPDLAREAGYLRAVTASAGLSLGDRFCLALARQLRLPAYTADRQWAKLPEAIGVEIVLIR